MKVVTILIPQFPRSPLGRLGPCFLFGKDRRRKRNACIFSLALLQQARLKRTHKAARLDRNAARKQRTGQTNHEHRLRLQAVEPDAPRWSTHGAERTKVLWLLPAQRFAKTRRVSFCWQRRSCPWIRHFSIFIKSPVTEEATCPRGFSFSLFFQILNIEMDAKLSKIYCSPQWYWKLLAAIKNLAAEAKISEDAAKKSLIKQTLWQINLTAPKHIPRPKFDLSTSNAVHQADLFLPHDNQDKSRSYSKLSPQTFYRPD